MILNLEIDDFRAKIIQAIAIGHFSLSGEIDLEATNAKNEWQYRKEFRK